MATEWKSQQEDGHYSLQFETDDISKYKLVEKAAKMAVDGQTALGDDIKHGEWQRQKNGFYFLCSVCGRSAATKGNYCHACGAKMDKGSTQ